MNCLPSWRAAALRRRDLPTHAAGARRGVGFGLDLTKRETQTKLKAAGLPWERSKAFTGSAIFSEFVTAPDTLTQLGVELRVDDVLRQKGDVSLMLYPPEVMLAELRHFLILEDFDIVMTGTPVGVGAVRAGERFHGRVLDREQELVSGACGPVSVRVTMNFLFQRLSRAGFFSTVRETSERDPCKRFSSWTCRVNPEGG